MAATETRLAIPAMTALDSYRNDCTKTVRAILTGSERQTQEKHYRGIAVRNLFRAFSFSAHHHTPDKCSSGRWFESCSCKPVRRAFPRQPYSYAKTEQTAAVRHFAHDAIRSSV